MNDTLQSALAIIRLFEGCRLTAYQDAVGVWTIGWGHTGSEVTPGWTITQQQADDWLEQTVESLLGSIQQIVTVPVTPAMLAALTSFAYNLGISSLAESTLLGMLNNGRYPEAAEQFRFWDHAGGQVLPGLFRRRCAEELLFLTGQVIT